MADYHFRSARLIFIIRHVYVVRSTAIRRFISYALSVMSSRHLRNVSI